MRPVVHVRPIRTRIRASGSKTFTVIWTVDGVEKTKSFPDATQGETFRYELETAVRGNVEFSRVTGLPTTAPGASITLLGWAITYFAKEWSDLAPRTRDTYVEALSRYIPVVCSASAPEPPEGMWAHLYSVLIPAGEVSKLTQNPSASCAGWLEKWSPSLFDIDWMMIDAAEVQLRLGPTDAEGRRKPRKPGTLTKWRRATRTVLNEAVRLGVLSKSPWPVAKRGRRKSSKSVSSRAIDVTVLPALELWPSLLATIVSHQPASWSYRAMSAIGLFGGLRPSETVELTVSDLTLPATGWGSIWVDKAWDGYEEAGDTKTIERMVPIPPELVAELQLWLERARITSGHLFRTRDGGRPAQSNWRRSLIRACNLLKIEEISPYDLRHSCASAMVGASMPLATAAEWLGHSVETLTSTYTHSLPGDSSRSQNVMSDLYARRLTAAAELVAEPADLS